MNIKRERDWHNLYKGGWGKELTPEAYCHPAKVARGLARKIYAYAIEQGYLKEGDICLDPFAGIGGFALDAMFHGLHHIGCELEEKFVQLGQQNIDLWNRRYGNGKLRRWGTAVILQGDSRNLVEVLEGARAEGIISSPPWEKSLDRGNVPKEARVKQAHDMGLSADKVSPIDMENIGLRTQPDYGTDPAQLGNMPTGEPPQAVIGSPPYANRRPEASGSGVNLEKQYQTYQAQGGGASLEKFCATQKLHSQDYGTSDGQLAALPEGEPPQIDGCISSPPYEGSLDHAPGNKLWNHSHGTPGNLKQVAYSEDDQNLGNIASDTFWSAARAILLQCHQVIGPGGHAIFVTKRFVRDKKIVEFSQQWADLCQSCGFELVEWIKAWLVEERGTQYDLEGEAHTKTVKRFSFFRRLHAQKYPHLAIEWEDVLIFRKPIKEGGPPS